MKSHRKRPDRDRWTYIGEPWRTVLKNVHVYFFHQPADEFDTKFKEAADALKAVFMRGDYVFSNHMATSARPKLESKTNIHSALKNGFTKTYGFTSDEQGIRHALLEKESPAVDEADALFMIGACSAFVSYLVSKARSVDLLK